jgi:murein L,D-transpeptidase YcbB/YkuD
MSPKPYIISAFSLLFVFCACMNSNSQGNKDQNIVSIEKLQKAIEMQFTAGTKDSSMEFFDTLKSLYSKNGFAPVFFAEKKQNADSIGSLLASSFEHGLNPQWYHVKEIKEGLDALRKSSNESDIIANQARLEILLADAVVKYSSHIKYGVLNPVKMFGDRYDLPYPSAEQMNVFEALKQQNIFQYLKDIQPKAERYIKLQSALKTFRLANDKGWSKIKPIGRKLRVGDKSPLLKDVVSRLVTLHYLDTNKVKIFRPDKMDAVISKAIYHFQQAQGLIPDGVPGNETIEKLNIPAKVYIEKIKLSLERFRWNNYTSQSRYLYVNIPDFHLHLIDEQKEQFSIRVCTGRKKPDNFNERYAKYLKTHNLHDRPDNWESPQVASEITTIVLNPTWSVPPNIIREEIYPGVMRDSNYLSKRNFKVYRGNQQVNLKSINLKKYSPNKVPFSFVQDPGPGNALGKMKFLFKNKFDIYLHDTPTRPPFAKAMRAVSHGCIRVEKPMLLAEYLLKNHQVWNIDYLKCEINLPTSDKMKAAEYKEKRNNLRKYMNGAKYTNISVQNKLPVYVDYFTTWVDESGCVNLRNDIYGKDKIMLSSFTAVK